MTDAFQSPANVNEIQTILKVMNRVKIPLWTCSRGKNLGYGGPAPRVRGSIILSLHRMTRILEVDEKAAFAVVEPGVTFAELSAYCLDNKPSVWPSIPGLGWGSVVGNVSCQCPPLVALICKTRSGSLNKYVLT